MADEKPKIIVDDDWKTAARAEKEKLAAAEKQAREKAAEGGANAQEPLTFDDITRMFAMQALTYLGAFPDPESGRAVLAPDVAKLHIDLLGILEEKTKGNLSEEEEKNLKESVRELRQQFVMVMEAVKKAQAEGRVDPKTGAIRMGEGEGGMPGGAGGMPGGGPRPGPGMGGLGG